MRWRPWHEFLVVDDNDGIRDLVRDVLGWAGHETEGAQDGVDALEVVQRWSPDVIVAGCDDAAHGRAGVRPQLPRPARPARPHHRPDGADDGPRRAVEMQACSGSSGKPFHPERNAWRLVDRFACAEASVA